MSLSGAVPWWESRAGTVESLDAAQWTLLDPTSNLHMQLETCVSDWMPSLKVFVPVGRVYDDAQNRTVPRAYTVMDASVLGGHLTYKHSPSGHILQFRRLPSGAQVAGLE